MLLKIWRVVQKPVVPISAARRSALAESATEDILGRMKRTTLTERQLFPADLPRLGCHLFSHRHQN